MQIYNFLKKYIKIYLMSIVLLVLTSIVAGTISMYGTYVIGNFIDILIRDSSIQSIYKFALLLAVLSVLSMAISYISYFFNSKTNLKMSNKITLDVIEHYQDISIYDTYDTEKVYLSGRISADSNTVTSFCLTLMQTLIVKIVALIISYLYLLYVDLWFAVAFLFVMLVYVFAYFMFKKILYIKGFTYKEKSAEYINAINEQISFIRYIQINVIQKVFIGRFKLSFVDLYRNGMNFQKVANLYNVIDSSILSLSNVILFILGGIRVIEHTMTIGQFTVVLGFSGIIVSCIRYFFGLGQSFQDCKISVDRIIDIMSIDQPMNGTILVDNVRKITLKNVVISFNQFIVVRGFSCELVIGNMYLLCGQNGCGKSSLINVIIGLNRKYSGQILYDNVDLMDCDTLSLRKNNFAVLEQSLHFPKGSIVEYISNTNEKKYCENDILSLAKKIDKQTFFPLFVELLDSDIGDDKKMLSGGEKQKIEILRVLLKNSRIMVFDEPTSNLDPKSRDAFYAYLSKIKSNKIIIVVSHNVEEQHNFDHIVDIEKN